MANEVLKCTMLQAGPCHGASSLVRPPHRHPSFSLDDDGDESYAGVPVAAEPVDVYDEMDAPPRPAAAKPGALDVREEGRAAGGQPSWALASPAFVCLPSRFLSPARTLSCSSELT